MPKYQFPLSDQDDYRGRILFTTIIETPASIDQAALDRVSNASSEGIGDVLSALKDFGTKEIQSGYATPGEYAKARSLFVAIFLEEDISIFPGFL